MNTTQNNNKNQSSSNTGKNGMLANVTSSLSGAVGSLRNGSTSLVNTVSGMSTGKKVLALAALAFGARMLQNRMKRA